MIAKVTNYLIAHIAVLLPAAIAISLVISATARAFALAVLRFAARPLLLLAVVALVYDGTRTLAGGSGLVMTSLADHWNNLAPNSLAAFHAQIMRLGYPGVWDDGILKLLRLPAWLVAGVLGFLLAYIGRKREGVKVFVN
jgi:hypothetical protein